jgi:CspA family cold shock protein
MSQKEIGIVKWFDDEKGFGFIAPDNGGIDIFAHYREIQCDGHQTLKEGQRVSYIVGRGFKGPLATQITVL